MPSDISPISRAEPVTPGDAPSGPGVITMSGARALYLGTAGNVAVVLSTQKNGETRILKGLAAGMWHPVCVKQVLATGTTAADILVGAGD